MRRGRRDFGSLTVAGLVTAISEPLRGGHRGFHGLDGLIPLIHLDGATDGVVKEKWGTVMQTSASPLPQLDRFQRPLISLICDREAHGATAGCRRCAFWAGPLHDYRAQGVRIVVEDRFGVRDAYFVEAFALSSHAVGLIAGVFIHPKSSCFLQLVTTDMAPLAVAGTVAYCDYLGKELHVVVLPFSEPIDVTRIAKLGPIISADRPPPCPDYGSPQCLRK